MSVNRMHCLQLFQHGLCEPISVSGYEYTEKFITSSEILSMGTQPIELLPAPGPRSYYEYKIFLEYTEGTAPYGLVDNYFVGDIVNYLGTIIAPSFLTQPNDKMTQVSSVNAVQSGIIIQDASTNTVTFGQEYNLPIMLTTWYANDLTLGDGTILAKIWYKIFTAA